MHMENKKKTIVWFRRDLRIKDNESLIKAAELGDIIALYIYDEQDIGGAQKWWLYHSLQSLRKDLSKYNIPLILRKGDTFDVIKDIAKQVQAGQVFWNRRYEPNSMKIDSEVKKKLKQNNIHAESFNSSLLFEPWTIQNNSGEFYKVFSAFWRGCMRSNQEPRTPSLTTPFNNADNYKQIESDDLNSWQLLPQAPDWSSKFSEFGVPGEDNAHKTMDKFIECGLQGYAKNRDIPSCKYGTSKMSAYLHFGEISPHQLWHKVMSMPSHEGMKKDVERYLAELGWREFSYHLLYNNNDLNQKEFNNKFKNFPWANNKEHLKKWQKGQTGYPIVDAGMRELWATGWMHNRVRMIVASFLTKHLLIHWKHGLEWFEDTLLDADMANNSASWQWVAGCGADAAPYFRIFNPIIQGKKFDPEGEYVRKWVPEIAKIPNKFIHAPWEADNNSLIENNIFLGKTYPKPIVDHAEARNKAMSAYQEIR